MYSSFGPVDDTNSVPQMRVQVLFSGEPEVTIRIPKAMFSSRTQVRCPIDVTTSLLVPYQMGDDYFSVVKNSVNFTLSSNECAKFRELLKELYLVGRLRRKQIAIQKEGN